MFLTIRTLAALAVILAAASLVHAQEIDEAKGADSSVDYASLVEIVAELQGLQKAVYHNDAANNVKEFVEFEMMQPGILSEKEYEQVVTDIVNFLAYLSEPAQLVRKKIGIGVLFFLAFLGAISYFMKRDYWKDVH